MKVAIVVQRYGADINGGAEQHARYVAEHLAKHVQVEVLTTCAHRDYITWQNELPAGHARSVHGIPVHRFPVARRARPDRVREVVGEGVHAAALAPRRAGVARRRRADQPGADRAHQGSTKPTSTSSSSSASAITTRIHGCRAVPSKAILVPTAERDGALGPRHLSADVPRRARVHVQLVRRARADSGRVEQPVGAGRGRRHRLGDSRALERRRGSARSSTCAIGSRSTSAASTRTRAASSCSISSSTTARRSSTACTSC